MKQVIRIIGGKYRGKKITFPAIEGLRPTPDRVKETLFNWLMHDIQGARCLDAFAGSGGLGLEAFSRGAEKVVLVEQSALAYENLKKTVLTFNSPQLELLKLDARFYLKSASESYDIIFLDPPFAANYQTDCLDDIAHNAILNRGGLLYLESPTIIDVDASQWQQLKLKQAGQVVYGLYKKL